jgi:hypothetical protein
MIWGTLHTSGADSSCHREAEARDKHIQVVLEPWLLLSVGLTRDSSIFLP